MSFFREQEIARRTARMHAENRGRLATTKAVFDTYGWGSFEFEEIVDFDCMYIEEPTFTVGAVIDVDEWEQALEDADYPPPPIDLSALPAGVPLPRDVVGIAGVTPLPVVTGFVTAWEQDDKGNYVGAYCAARVYFPEVDIPTELSTQNLPAVHHHFRFEAVALKGGGDDTGDAANGAASTD